MKLAGEKVLVFLLVATTFSATGDPRPARPWVPERELNNVWRFNVAEEWTNPRTGSLRSFNTALAESWSDFSLRMAGAQPALFAQPAVSASGHVNLSSDSGLLRLWVSLHWASSSVGGKGPGAKAVLLEMGAWEGAQASPHGRSVLIHAGIGSNSVPCKLESRSICCTRPSNGMKGPGIRSRLDGRLPRPACLWMARRSPKPPG